MIDPKVKEAFSGVKQDIEALKAEISEIKAKLIELADLIIKTSKEQEQKTPKNAEFEGFKPYNQDLRVSSGNEGVKSINQSSINHQSITKSRNQSQIASPVLLLGPNSSHRDVDERFSNLRKRQFLLFLTVYQLEDELGRGPTYTELALKLKVSEDYLRGIISVLTKSGIPIIRKRLNNKVTILTIDPEFKKLDLKSHLTQLYYDLDPDQTKLFDN